MKYPLGHEIIKLIQEHAKALTEDKILHQKHHITLLDSLIKVAKDELED